MSVKIAGNVSNADLEIEATSKAARVIDYDGSGNVRASGMAVGIAPAANTGGTLTIPAAGPGLFHYITKIHIQRCATAALAGTAALTITTTNLPGPTSLRVGNAMAAGGTVTDADLSYNPPLKSSVANVNTTLVFPAPGAAVLWTATAYYYTAP